MAVAVLVRRSTPHWSLKLAPLMSRARQTGVRGGFCGCILPRGADARTPARNLGLLRA